MHQHLFKLLFLQCVCSVLLSSPAAAEPLTPKFGAVRGVASDYFGVNQNTVQNPGWASNPLATALVKDLKFGSVRYPGGTVANFFDWRTGTTVPGSGQRLDHRYELGDLAFIQREAGAIPTFVLNMSTGRGLEDQMEQLIQAKALGLPIRRVELGNEFYLGSSSYKAAFGDGAEYGRTAKAWAARVRELFPGAEVAAVAAQNLPSTDPDSRIGRWNAEMFSELSPDDVDALTLHYYGGSTLGGVSTRRPDKFGTPEAQRAQHDALQADTGPDRFIGAAFGYVNAITRTTDVPEGFDLWITENNLFDRTGPARHTWAHGMYNAAVQAQLLRDERVTQTHFHNLINQASLFGLSFTGEGNEFNGLLTEQLGITQDLTPEAGALTASGHVMKMFGEALGGVDRAQRLFFEPTPKVGGDGSGVTEHPAILGFRLFDDDDDLQRIFLLNLGGESLEVDTSRWLGRLDEVLSLSGDPRRYVIDAQDVTLTSSVLGPGSSTLQPYSLTLLRAPVVVPEPAAAASLLVLVLSAGRRRPAGSR